MSRWVNGDLKFLSNKLNAVIWVHTFVVIPLLFIDVVIYNTYQFNNNSTVYANSVISVILYVWLLGSLKISYQGLFNPYGLFLIAAILFNAGQVILEFFGLNEHGILNGNFSSKTIIETMFLVNIGLSFFHLGALISIPRLVVKTKFTNKIISSNRKVIYDRDIRLIGWYLLAISLIPTIVLLKDAISVVLNSGYFGLYQRDSVTGFGAIPRILAEFLVPASLFILAGSKNHKSGKLISGVLILSYSVIQFYLGSRSSAAMPLIAYAWLWDRNIRKIPRTILLVSGIFLLFIIFPLVKAFRNIVGENRIELIDIFFGIDNPIVTILSEMGGSMKTVAYTIDLVPVLRDYDMGLGYIYALLTIIPNMFWDIHPTIARGLAADWLVWTVDPIFASKGGGLGYSFIAEAYLNFGWTGSVIVLCIFGYLFGKLNAWSERSRSSLSLALVATFLSFFLFFARGESASIVRPLLWYSVIPYIAVYVTSLLKKRKQHKERKCEDIEGIIRSRSQILPRQ